MLRSVSQSEFVKLNESIIKIFTVMIEWRIQKQNILNTHQGIIVHVYIESYLG